MKRSGPLKRRQPLRRNPASQRANARKRWRNHEPKVVTKTCAQCGGEFTVHIAAGGSTLTRKFCSKRCFYNSRRTPVTRRCAVCGAEFETTPSANKKTCSRKCANEAIARAKRGALNPRATSLTEAKARWRSAKKKRCEKCGSRDRLRQHHVVYEQHVRREGGDIYDPRNSLTLCWGCHNGHHNGLDKRLRTCDLTPANIEFANELLGEKIVDYWPRYYDTDRVAVVA